MTNGRADYAGAGPGSAGDLLRAALEAQRHLARPASTTTGATSTARSAPACPASSNTGSSMSPTTSAGIFPAVSGVSYATADDDQFDGIAELTFRSPADRQTWFDAAGILMDDEHNIFSKAIGYVTEPGNSQTYVDGLAAGDPERRRRLHQVPCAGPPGARSQQRRVPPLPDRQLRRPGRQERARPEVPPAPVRAAGPVAARCRRRRPLSSRPNGSTRPPTSWPSAISSTWSASSPRPSTRPPVRDRPRFVQQVSPFPERDAYTFVYDGRMTLAGQRGSRTAELITRLGATNQLRADIHDLVVGRMPHSMPLAGAATPRPVVIQPGRQALAHAVNGNGKVATNGNGKVTTTGAAPGARTINGGSGMASNTRPAPPESAPQLLPGSCGGLFHTGAGPQAYCGSADRGR